MKTTVIYVCTILFLFSLKIQSRAIPHTQGNDSTPLFQAFLNEFATYGKEKIDSATFGHKFFDSQVDKEKYEAFLPKNSNCLCLEDDVLWQAGSMIQKGDIIAVFLKRHCFEDEYESYCDYMVITYTREGKLTDYRSVGRSGRLYECSIEGDTRNISMTSVCGDLLNKEQLRDYGDLIYAMTKKKFTVSKEGKIKEKAIGKQWIKSVVQKDGIVRKVEFEDYVNLFLPLEGDKIPDEWQSKTPYKELEYSYAKTFIPDSADCNCERRNLLWHPCFKQERNDFIAVFLHKLCDLPKEGCMYTDYLIITYSKDGTVIDMQRIVRRGDLWEAYIDESSTASSILVKQGFIDEKSIDARLHVLPIDVIVTQYDITPDGKIHQKTVGTYHSTCHHADYGYRFVFE
ncbi:MAG: hypothetical protein NC252_02665 [Roseburia sp.]|nr:hypothetical protein [Roseburia sp.]